MQHNIIVSVLIHLQKKFILQAGTTSDGVSIIDVVPIDQSESTDDAPITVSTILPTNSGASSPNNSNSQQITAQVAFVQAPDSAEISEAKPHFITVNGKWITASRIHLGWKPKKLISLMWLEFR